MVIPLLALSSALLISSCDNASQPKEEASTSTKYSYQCKSGEVVVATYPSDSTSTVTYKDRTYNMSVAVSGSGARYVGEGLEWWTKGTGSGSEGMLLHHKADGTSGEVIENCTEK
ncbi:MAG: hypothetical protein CSB47_06380 [Proteobacteria bacterium]|nr:MAG: hypothetical protein CSB47_06380 [Pseudomonadota bacterium]